MSQSPALATSCVDSEPGPLPSTGITRLPRYYRPLRHPPWPGLAVTGNLLETPTSTIEDFPCCARSSSFVQATANTPARLPGARSALFPSSLSLPRIDWQVARASPFSKLAQRSLTLQPVRSPSHPVTLYTEGFSHFVTSMTGPMATGWSESRRVGFAPTGQAPLGTAQVELGWPVSTRNDMTPQAYPDWRWVDHGDTSRTTTARSYRHIARERRFTGCPPHSAHAPECSEWFHTRSYPPDGRVRRQRWVATPQSPAEPPSCSYGRG